MKNYILVTGLIFMLFYSSRVESQVKFSGTWKGFQMKDSTSDTPDDLYYLDFVIINGLLEGKIRVETNSKRVYIAEIKGTKNKRSFSIDETRIQMVSNKNIQPNLSAYNFNYNNDRGYLEGFKKDSAKIGKIILYKSEFNFSEKLTVSKHRHWATTILSEYNSGLSSPQKRIEELKCFSFEPVYFDYDKDEIKSEYFSQLNEIKKIVLSHSDLRILVVGHTDSDGSNVYNESLSKRRAESIIQFFTSRGLRRDRIVIDFKGETLPVESNATSKGKSKNRRVDFKFI